MCNYDLCKCKHFMCYLVKASGVFIYWNIFALVQQTATFFKNVLSSTNKYSIHLKGLSLFICEKVLQLGQCTDWKVGADQHITTFYEFISGLWPQIKLLIKVIINAQ